MVNGNVQHRGSVSKSVVGRRRAKREESAYVSPLAARLIRQGKAGDVAARLLAARRKVARGLTLVEVVGDGTALGWATRIALTNALGEALANWDNRPGRTQLERAALVERVLGELGHKTLSIGGAL